MRAQPFTPSTYDRWWHVRQCTNVCDLSVCASCVDWGALGYIMAHGPSQRALDKCSDSHWPDTSGPANRWTVRARRCMLLCRLPSVETLQCCSSVSTHKEGPLTGPGLAIPNSCPSRCRLPGKQTWQSVACNQTKTKKNWIYPFLKVAPVLYLEQLGVLDCNCCLLN